MKMLKHNASLAQGVKPKAMPGRSELGESDFLRCTRVSLQQSSACAVWKCQALQLYFSDSAAGSTE